MVRTILATPPAPRVVPEGVFDAYGWCPSDTLEWRRPASWDASAEVTGDNPARMAFVLRAPCDFLPRELASLHVPGLELEGAWALAPYGIDDATDELHARRVAPADLLWLAASDLAGLVWGLHDWAHFHNHGPFEQRALTELQCDLSALAWLWHNRSAAGVDAATWERARASLSGVARRRLDEEGVAWEGDPLAAESVLGVARAFPRVSARARAG